MIRTKKDGRTSAERMIGDISHDLEAMFAIQNKQIQPQ
jgi:hypothetical protein